jgi:hypothetical protein
LVEILALREFRPRRADGTGGETLPPFKRLAPLHAALLLAARGVSPGWFLPTAARHFMPSAQNSGVNKVRAVLPLLFLLLIVGCKIMPAGDHARYSRFVAVTNFSHFTAAQTANGETVLLSPEIPAHIPWNELIVSWNADAPAGTFVKLEACAASPGHNTKFYTIANWTLDDTAFPRTSVRGQKDADGKMDMTR